MAIFFCKQSFLAGLFALSGMGAASAWAAAPDAGLFTTYSLGAGYQTVNYVVCGSTLQTEGCYSAGSLGPFGRVGAMVEGSATTIGSTVTRGLYIVDTASGPSGTGVTLYRYLKTDAITASYDTTTFKLTNTVALPLIGGTKAVGSMAANKGFLFIGTNQSPTAVRVQKGVLAVTQIGGFSAPITVSSITADDYGYVTVSFGSFSPSAQNGFYLFGPDGQLREDGGGASFLLTSVTGLSTTALPTSAVVPASRLVVKPRSTQSAPAVLDEPDSIVD